MKLQETLSSYSRSEKEKNKDVNVTLSDFKLFQATKAIISKIIWHWHKNRHKHQWSGVENSEINTCINGQLVLDKGTQNTQWIEYSLFHKWYWGNLLHAN